MKFGFFGINMNALAEPVAMRRAAQAAEAAGYESIWTGEHVVLIDPQAPPSPARPETEFLDTIATLAFLAGCTERMKLGSGIILLPQRNPVVLAKELAGIDVLSGGRLLFGVGVGYVRKEFEVIGVPFGERGARTSEHIDAIRALWTQDQPDFAGRFTSISGIQSHPHPVQTPHPPIIIGGSSPPAFRRAVRQGNGYYGFAQDVEATAATIEALKRAAQEVNRPEELGDLEITITPPRSVDPAMVDAYEQLGVRRLVLLGGRGDAVEFLDRAATDLRIG